MSKAKKKYLCLVCDKAFSTQGNLDRHKKILHNIDKECLEYAEDAKMYKCSECGISFQFNGDLRKHLQKEHDMKNEIENLTFLNYDEFTSWLTTEETINNIQFIKHTGVKRKADIETIYLDCIRSGKDHTTVIHRKRSQKRSRRINRHCTSQIIVKKNMETGECNVQYFKMHYGHENTLNFLRLRTADREDIAAQLIQGLSPKRILEEIRKDKKPTFRRKDLVTRKDIWNIKRLTFNTNDKKEQLKKDIEATALRIIKNVSSENHTIDQLTTVLRSLKSCVASFNSHLETNTNSLTPHITVPPDNKDKGEHSYISVKKQFITINRSNLKPYINGDIKDQRGKLSKRKYVRETF